MNNNNNYNYNNPQPTAIFDSMGKGRGERQREKGRYKGFIHIFKQPYLKITPTEQQQHHLSHHSSISTLVSFVCLFCFFFLLSFHTYPVSTISSSDESKWFDIAFSNQCSLLRSTPSTKGFNLSDNMANDYKQQQKKKFFSN